jgi:UDP-4-amino-4,6-dideoxy-N-acetyl-beta-L-altrosamine transaminase
MNQMEKLAIHGGKPVRNSLLSYGSQWVIEEDIAAVVETMRSPFLTQGPQITEFERKVADKSGAKYAVAFCNGTAALHGAMFAAGIGEGDEVITSPLTFAATSNSVLYQGGIPVFADIDPHTYLLDVEAARNVITPHTKAIVPVDFSGQPVNMQAFRALADEHGLVYIQDAAHSLGASYDGKPVGSIADMTMFSFHPVKPVTTAEGGVIVTNNEEYYEKLLRFRSHGITKDNRWMEGKSEGPWYYQMIELGYNYRLTDIQAALGVTQMERLMEFLSRRNEIARQYDEAFAGLERDGLLRRPVVDVKAVSGWHLYVISLGLENLKTGRREVFEALQAENLGVNVHYIPVYWHPYYKKLGYERGICPCAEQAYETFVTIPLFPRMSDEDVQDVIAAVEKVVTFFAKA